MEILCNDGAYNRLLEQPVCILFLLPVHIYLGETELIWILSISPYPSRLDKMPNALSCLLPVATQQVCKFSSADCRRKVEIYFRTIESSNQLVKCFIWDIATEDCIRVQT